jgi:predicted Zn-dependent protease
MERMGHAQIATTQRYLHTLPDSNHRMLLHIRLSLGQESVLDAAHTPLQPADRDGGTSDASLCLFLLVRLGGRGLLSGPLPPR